MQTIYEVFNHETKVTVFVSYEVLETFFPELRTGVMEVVSEEQYPM